MNNFGVFTMRHPSGLWTYEMWGETSEGSSLALSHENLRGKHIKDRFGARSTFQLPGGALITVHAANAPAVGFVSIYDGNESHRIDLPSHLVTRSCALPLFEEAAEWDGETSRFADIVDGMRWEHIYDQDASPAGLPLGKVENIYPLGITSISNPNQVLDFYDDPRLGHTF
ncbi:MAG: hypothetical protein HOP28_15280 [Gemmatimonadales bacterium]|nr:hypothetical protein [Gemmatimonadales bacterium]